MRRARLPGMLLVLAVLASAVPVAAAPNEPGGSFRDDDGNVHEGMIEAVALAGITRGCNPPANDRYCPDDVVTRGQMAAFLARALELEPGEPGAFGDDDGSVFQADIEALASAGVTTGCGPDRFCPDDPVTRGQMAAFLTRAYRYPSAPQGNRFGDDDDSVFEGDIEALAAAGVTLGCNPPDNDRFCPDEPVRRDQMASFLGRAEGLVPIVPPERCPIFPADNIWNTRIDDLPVHPRSDEYIESIGIDEFLHPDFGSGVWPPGSNAPIGIPFVEVGDETDDVPITFTAYGDESDAGPYPVPDDAPIEGGPDSTGDRHVLVIDRDDCVLFELYRAFPTGSGWNADSGARYDLTSNALRPEGWTSADAAGLPIYAGLVRYDEVAAGEITHAIRCTVSQTQRAYVWPARHFASTITDPSVPPMGQRFRLKSDFDLSSFAPEVQVILTAFKRYGIVVADNGSDWYISGAPDQRWDNDVLRQLKSVPGSAFEAVDVSSLIVDPDSGSAAQGG